jgi:hypothetical protein
VTVAEGLSGVAEWRWRGGWSGNAFAQGNAGAYFGSMIVKRVVLVLAVWWAATSLGQAGQQRLLFNGQDLTGWETWLWTPLASSEVPGMERDANGNYSKALGVNNDPLRVFTVETVDGAPVIHVSGEGFGTLTTLEAFSNYRLSVQFKWGEKKFGAANKPRNGGILYHAHGRHGEVGDRWMNAHQYQIEEGGCGDYIGVGAVTADAPAKAGENKRRRYDPAGDVFSFSGNVKDAAKCLRGGGEDAPTGQWNTLELYCVGDEIVQVLNETVTARLTASRKENGETLTGGRIALQIEAAEIYFREIAVESLSTMPEALRVAGK